MCACSNAWSLRNAYSSQRHARSTSTCQRQAFMVEPVCTTQHVHSTLRPTTPTRRQHVRPAARWEAPAEAHLHRRGRDVPLAHEHPAYGHRCKLEQQAAGDAGGDHEIEDALLRLGERACRPRLLHAAPHPSATHVPSLSLVHQCMPGVPSSHRRTSSCSLNVAVACMRGMARRALALASVWTTMLSWRDRGAAWGVQSCGRQGAPSGRA